MIQSLFNLSEAVVLDSSVLSAQLSFLHFMRASRVEVKPGNKAIHALVVHVASCPRRLVDWGDHVLLSTVAVIANMRMINTEAYVPNIFQMMTRFEHYTCVVCDVLTTIYGDCADGKRLMLALDMLRDSVSTDVFRSVITTFGLRVPQAMFAFEIGKYLRYIDSQTVAQICRLAISSGVNINEIPMWLVTRDLCAHFISESRAELFTLVPVQFLDASMCKSAVELFPDNIGDVPSEYITREMCELAVDLKPDTIKYIPPHFQTWDMCVTAVMRDPIVILDVGTLFLTEDMLKKAIIACPSILPDLEDHDFPTEEIMLDLCIDASIENFDVYEYACMCIYNFDFYLESRVSSMAVHCEYQQFSDIFANNYRLIRFVVVPQTVISIVLHMDIKQHWRILKFINENIIEQVFTERVCDSLIAATELTLHYIPKYLVPRKYVRLDFFRECIIRNPTLVSIIPTELASQNMYERVVRTNPSMLSMIPDAYKTESLLVDILDEWPESHDGCACMIIVRNMPQHINKLNIGKRVIMRHPDYICRPELKDVAVNVSKHAVIQKLAACDYDFIKRMIDCVYQKENYLVLCAIVLDLKSEHWKELLSRYIHLAKLAPTSVLTQDICETMVIRDPSLISYIPLRARSPALITSLYKNYAKLDIVSRDIIDQLLH